MELKDMIISTLEELEEEIVEVPKEEEKQSKEEQKSEALQSDDIVMSSETQFYENLRERILVLFEGFQSPNNKDIEAKIDMTLNFLEYLLATIDERLDSLKSK